MTSLEMMPKPIGLSDIVPDDPKAGLDSVVTVRLLEMNTGIRVDVPLLQEALRADPTAASLDILNMSCRYDA